MWNVNKKFYYRIDSIKNIFLFLQFYEEKKNLFKLKFNILLIYINNWPRGIR